MSNESISKGGYVPKYKRDYILDYCYDPINKYWVRIRLPIALDFSVSRNNLASNNKCQLKLYNLSKRTRDIMFKDELDVGRPYNSKDVGFTRTDKSDDPVNQDQSKLKNRVELWVGYQSTSTYWKIFSGSVLSAYSYRSGVDYITEISGYTTNLRDPNVYFSFTAKAGMTKGNVIRQIATQLIGIQEIRVDPELYNEVFTKDQVLMGTAEEILTYHFGCKPFVDNQVLNVSALDDIVISNTPLVINSKNGLLSSPRRTQNGIRISMLFEPTVRVGDIVYLGAEREASFNKCSFAVSGFTHSGSVANNKDSLTTTDIELWKGVPGFFRVAREDIVGLKELEKYITIYEGSQDIISGSMLS